MTNRSIYRALGIVTLALMLIGCGHTKIVVVGYPPRGPVGSEAYIEDEATIAEIDAVRSLDFSSARTKHLYQIAQRLNLGPDAQVYLVDTAFGELDFEKETIKVIETLVENPIFSGDAKSRVLAHLSRLDFDSSKSRVLDALDRRGPVWVNTAQTQPDEEAAP